MTGQFLIDDARIRELSATRQGRVSLGGFTYQASYAVARLASMLARQPLFDLEDFPVALRHDWAEDLDEIDSDGRAIFTQCKRVDDIGQPAKLANVLLSFAPKLLWTGSARRPELRFRVVCTDPRFRGEGSLAFPANAAGLERSKVATAFVDALTTPPTDRSDRMLWQAEAEAFGSEALFSAIWEAAEGVYLRGAAIVSDPSGLPLLAAERSAIDLLVRHLEIDSGRQAEALKRLRALLHGNLISFDPASGLRTPGEPLSPRVIRRTDVHVELFGLRTTRDVAFRVVTPQFLEEQRRKEKQMYVARPPQWADVVHGQDQDIRFVERDLTAEVRDRVRSHILQPLARSTDERLPMLFLLGAPGAGKSTLMRRVVALLVEEGAVTAADFGLNLGELDQDEVKTIVSDLKGLATPERPVLLVLDDPFFVGSGWDRLLGHLARARFPVGVIGASPDFLYDAFGGSVRVDPFHTDVVTMLKPSGGERAALSILHDRELLPSDEDEDFLVLAMQAVSGEPFSAIVARIWRTLNDGHPIDPRAEPETLPWPVRAYLIACYFHRAYERCPESVLREALTHGGAAVPANYGRRIGELTTRNGWRIFSVQEPVKGNADAERAIGAGHHRIATEAWKLRPMSAFDVAEWVVPASIRTYKVSAVGRLAATLSDSVSEADTRLGARLARAWSEASDADAVPISSFALLAEVLASNAAPDEAKIMESAMRRRAERIDAQSWLAVFALREWFSPNKRNRKFPRSPQLSAVIEVADFSIANRRAMRFAAILRGGTPVLFAKYLARLFAALEGSLAWKLDGFALTWLLSRAPVAEITPKRLQCIRVWLDSHDSDNVVRAKVLNMISVLPFTDSLREEFLKDTALWLKRHDDDTAVRRGFLGVISVLPFTDSLREEFLRDTALWLKRHDDDNVVRTKFLRVISALGHEDELLNETLRDTALWLEEHADDTNVRSVFLSIAGSADVGFATLERSAALLDKKAKSWESVAGSMVQPYLRAAQLTKAKREKYSKEKLLAIRDSIVRWYESVGATPPDLDAMSPKSDVIPSAPSSLPPTRRTAPLGPNTRGFNTLADALRRALGKADDD